MNSKWLYFIGINMFSCYLFYKIYTKSTSSKNISSNIYGVYAGGNLGLQNDKLNLTDEAINNVINSKINMISWSLCHIGRGQDAIKPVKHQKTGDIIFNDDIIIQDQKLTTKATEWISQMNKLYKLSPIYFSWCFGGSPNVYDYQVIKENFVKNGKIDKNTILYKNMKILFDNFPHVCCINLDPEEDLYNISTTPFALMCAEIGFNISISPTIYGGIELIDCINIQKILDLYPDTRGKLTHITPQSYGGIPSSDLPLYTKNLPGVKIIWGMNNFIRLPNIDYKKYIIGGIVWLYNPTDAKNWMEIIYQFMNQN